MRYYDNTQVSAYKDCPRKYYFRHVRNWRSAGTSIDLIFGLAWHDAMDVVWLMINQGESSGRTLAMAHAQFTQTWLEQGGPGMEEMELPLATPKLQVKNPGVAAEMLSNYIRARGDFLREIEIWAIERPFMVPLYEDQDIQYIGRLDKGFTHQGRDIIGEHKTTGAYKKGGPFRDDYIASYSPNSQIDGYLYAAHMLRGDRVKGVWVDAALCHKTIHDGFKFIPVDRATEQMDAWLFEVRMWISRIEKEKLYYNTSSNKNRPYLDCFPKDTGACGHYTGCVYRDICRFIYNPSQLDGPPDGYIEEEWVPFDVLGLANLTEGQKDETPS